MQDETTASMTTGVQAALFALADPAFAASQARWEGYISDRALPAVRTYPDKRVVVIGSSKNRGMLERFVREAAPQSAISASY